MLEVQEEEAIDKGMVTLWVIWAAMLGSLLLYIFICHQPGVGFKSAEGFDVPLGLLRSILFGMSAVALFIAYFMKRFVLSARSGLSKSKPVEHMVRWNAPPLFAKYATAVIISLALSESIGIYGFVLFLLGDSFQTLYTFMVVSALAMLFYRPKREELVKLAMAYSKRDGSAPKM
jgi:hypothetical protein